MISALNTILPTFCTTWSLKKYMCVAAPANTKPGVNGLYCVFLDTSTSAGALAFHTENANIPYGNIFVKTILQYGGAIQMGVNNKVPTVAQAFAHEILEMLVNPNVNIWWQQSSGTLVPAEVCDPVQGNIVPVKVGTVTVGLSDYVLPAWSDPQSTSGPYNLLNTLRRPFEMAKGGYLVTMKGGAISNVYGVTASPFVQYRAEAVTNYINEKYSSATVVDSVSL